MIINEDGSIVSLYDSTEKPNPSPSLNTVAPFKEAPVLSTTATKGQSFNSINEQTPEEVISFQNNVDIVADTASTKEIAPDASSIEEDEYKDDTKYPGDLIDKSTPLNKETGCTTSDALPFKTSAQLLAFFHDSINKGIVSIHPWQLDVSNELCLPVATYKEPVKFCLIAANGSGKDAFVIAPFAVWFALTKIKSRCIITSSSGHQLTIQTEAYIKDLCQKVNEFFGQEYFRIRQRYIKCRLTGSEIRMFATDEAGKAEGYHPIEPNAEMAIIVNEGKSVSDDIHKALRRCTGFTHWLESSSPGEPHGFFHLFATNEKLNFKSRYITSFDCPHISEAEREEDKVMFGEHSSFYRSKHLALFTSLGGDVIIPSDVVEQLLLSPPQLSFPNWKKRIGIDLAAGGDESVVVIAQGCKILKEYFCREIDTTLTADWIDRILTENHIDKNHEFMYADDGGVGRAIIDNLVRRGWQIKRILNQSPAILKRQYGNRGAELWYNVKRIIEEHLFDVSTCSKKMLDQLTTRKNKTANNGARVFLESKKEARSQGRPSPDRADAFILSFVGLTIENFLQDGKSLDNGSVRKREVMGRSQAEVKENYENKHTYEVFNYPKNIPIVLGKRRAFGSISSCLNRQQNNN